MVFIIAGASESGRNTVGRMLAEFLGWEFVDAQNLHPHENRNVPRCSTPPANAGPHFRIETLSAAVELWIYEWRDVVVSCPVLVGEHERKLAKVSSLVKIVCVEAAHAAGRSSVLDRFAHLESSQAPSERHAPGEPGQDMLGVDSPQQREEIIAELAAALLSFRRFSNPAASSGTGGREH